MSDLADRLRRVRVCSGDWLRVCGPTPTVKQGLTGIFLDPPYSHAERDRNIYAMEMETADAVREWAIANGNNPRLRIALCGYEGEHEMPAGWTVHAWKATGGYASRGSDVNENAERERVWQQMVKLYPPFADYQKAAGSRRIPVIGLKRV